MNEDNLRAFYQNTSTTGYVENALNARRHRDKVIQQLLEKKKLPEVGWDDDLIEYVLQELSWMDTNRFSFVAGAGEREGRVFSNLVTKRHFGFAHGIGRSGDLTEPQPKAIGSTILNDITNKMLLDVVKVAGIQAAKKCLLVPMATGMTLSFCFSHIRNTRKTPKDRGFVLWSRIDQKSCFKSMFSAGLVPVIVDTLAQGDLLSTNLNEFRDRIVDLGAENIVCIFSTTSCFAPRGCDDVINLAKLAREYSIPHVVNNAYGLQSSLCCHQIEQAVRLGGRVDFVVQSTDKNLLVPVGGSIVVAFEEQMIDNLAKSYPGRASISQSIDVFITLLSMGEKGFRKLLLQQKECFEKLKISLQGIAEEFSETVLDTFKGNRISLALTLSKYSHKDGLAAEIGSRLFRRGVTGARVVSGNEIKTIENRIFDTWGSHTSSPKNVPYLTVAAALGCRSEEIDTLCEKLRQILKEIDKEALQKQ
ncbi:O-phosphoseryl-tRNA(Sec) selenium transferase [Phlebotomus papatasi]|uniref:O-phosphoseryl-tRNA(Sec) selenium transferase n=1 Tax=Phlebotomus papatasi TaxID=29031 RepID=UPI0024844A9F|nr:O-phosphoseryl-tRNA(Sec) selenium transferase [Phlebotomus papatasi]